MFEFSTVAVQNQPEMKEKYLKNNLDLEIQWSTAPTLAWSSIYAAARRSSLLQSPLYAHVMAGQNSQRVRYGLVCVDGVHAGVVLALEVGVLKNALHAVIIDCAPTWRAGYGTAAQYEAFIAALRVAYPKRFGRKIRLIPNIAHSAENHDLLRAHGFQGDLAQSCETYWVDLTQSLTVLRQNLKKSWRNTLSKAEREKITIDWRGDGAHMHWLMTRYAEDKAARGYGGASLKTLVPLCAAFAREGDGQKNFRLGVAMLDNRPIAAILLFIHGSAATYQIGYTTQDGRKLGAHHLLLWRAVTELKERDIYDFDLGGINGASAKGVADFKRGMGGRLHKTLGLYT